MLRNVVMVCCAGALSCVVSETIYAVDRPAEFFSREGGGVFVVAGNEAVQKSLGLDAATSAKVTGIVGEYFKRMSQTATEYQRELFKLARTKSGQDEKKKREEELDAADAATRKKIHEAAAAELSKALTMAQLERVKQISWQAFGSQSLLVDGDLAKQLGLRKEQRDSIAGIHGDAQRRLAGMLGNAAAGDPQKRKEVMGEREAKSMEVLSREQRAQLEKLEGARFDKELLNLQQRLHVPD